MTAEKPDPEACRAAALSLAADPLRFVSACWPQMQIYDRQREVLLSVRDNVETFVHAANETGKTRVAAVVVLWFFTTRTPARVISSSSSQTQLDAILWSEIHSLIRASRLPLPFLEKSLCLKKLRRLDSTETEPSDYVLGYVTNAVENFQGHHLPNDKPRVLAVFDEASGVPDEFYEAADSWAHRKLVIVIAQIVQDTPNTMEIAGRTIRLLEEHKVPAGRVAFDAGGGGKQIADLLHEQRYFVQLIGFGESAAAKQAYKNRRAEMYGRLRELLNPDREEGPFALPPDAHSLRQELAVLPLQYDSEGRMQLLPKEAAGPQQGPSLRRLLGRSPDRADSLVLATWVLSRPQP